MLNMTIEQFEEKLDELIDLHKQILEKEKYIDCKAEETNILFFETDTLLTFAQRKEVQVLVKRNDGEEEICRYKYTLCYRDVELIAFSTGRSYQLYREGGLIS